MAKGAAEGTAVLKLAVSAIWAIWASPVIPVIDQAVVSVRALWWWGG